MLVWALCQQGISDPVSVPPAAYEALSVESLAMGGDAEARIRSARACVQWREGSHETALSEIGLALGLVSDPGAMLERAERMIVRARILESTGDRNAARAQVDAAIELFAARGVEDHPNVAAFRRLEQELAAASLPAGVGSVR